MQEQTTGLVRSVFTAISRINYEALDSALAEAETAGVLQQLLTAEDHRGLTRLEAWPEARGGRAGVRPDRRCEAVG
jgi:hypothetical protein